MKYLFLFILLLGSSVVAGEKKMSGYIVIGQSNANGRSYSNEFSVEALREDYGTNILYAYRERSWQNGTIPEELALGKVRPDGKNRVGIEVTLGRYLAAHSPEEVLLLKFCSGGTSIINFLPESENLFEPMITYLAEQKENVEKRGYSLEWKGLFVITGESDSKEGNAEKFRSRFVTVRNALKEELGIESLPTVFGLLRGNWVDTPASNYSKHDEFAALINRDMTELAGREPMIKVTPSSADLQTRFDRGDSKTDGIHYTSDSYAVLGRRLYEKAFPDSVSRIDQDHNRMCDVFEKLHEGKLENGKRNEASGNTSDTDRDGVADSVENLLEGFDPDNDDSFRTGQAFSDLHILLSRLEGTEARQQTVSAVWMRYSGGQTSGTLNSVEVLWKGPQHETTLSNGQIVTTNSSGSEPVEHIVTFSEPVEELQVSVSGMAQNNSVAFDNPFSVVEKSRDILAEGKSIVGKEKSNSSASLLFSGPLKELTISVPGNDAMSFLLKASVIVPGKPLQQVSDLEN